MSQKDTLSVSQFISMIKTVVNYEPQFQNVAIVGEISNFTAHRSGHFYFNLKDEKANIKAIMFRSNTSSVKFKPQNGDKVVVVGSLDVYEAGGTIQLYVRKMQRDGLGDLHIEFERLKKELFEKGYFEEALKKKLPLYPKSIGIITGKDTAAHADMARTIQQRWPYAKVSYYFSLVQGEYAKQDLVKNLQEADGKHDVLVIARGGGSIEDLWPFNELEVVLVVSALKTPLISGVGHETDTTLVDYVSDYRAATPTAAAVAATPSQVEIKESLRNYKNQFYRSTVLTYRKHQTELQSLLNMRSFKNPNTLLDRHYMRLDLINSKLLSHTNIFSQTKTEIERKRHHSQTQVNRLLTQHKHQLEKYQNYIQNQSEQHFSKSQYELKRSKTQLIQLINKRFNKEQMLLHNLYHKFDLLNPFSIMKRGYGIIKDDNQVIRSIEDIKIGSNLNIQIQDGSIMATVHDKKGKNHE